MECFAGIPGLRGLNREVIGDSEQPTTQRTAFAVLSPLQHELQSLYCKHTTIETRGQSGNEGSTERESDIQLGGSSHMMRSRRRQPLRLLFNSFQCAIDTRSSDSMTQSRGRIQQIPPFVVCRHASSSFWCEEKKQKT